MGLQLSSWLIKGFRPKASEADRLIRRAVEAISHNFDAVFNEGGGRSRRLATKVSGTFHGCHGKRDVCMNEFDMKGMSWVMIEWVGFL
jgi:hypothetical protein